MTDANDKTWADEATQAAATSRISGLFANQRNTTNEPTMTAWTPDQPLRADATRKNVTDRMQYLYENAKSLAEATAPWYAAAMVVEVQNANRALLASSREEVERLAVLESAYRHGYNDFADVIGEMHTIQSALRAENARLTAVLQRISVASLFCGPCDDLDGHAIAVENLAAELTALRDALTEARRDGERTSALIEAVKAWYDGNDGVLAEAWAVYRDAARTPSTETNA